MALDARSRSSTGSDRASARLCAAVAQQGASVVVNDVDGRAAYDAVAAIEARGGRARRGVAPVGPARQRRLSSARRSAASAGWTSSSPTRASCATRLLWKMSDDEFDAVMTCTLRWAPSPRCAPAVRHMRRSAMAGGSSASVPPPASAATSDDQLRRRQAGIVGMVRTWALEARARRTSPSTRSSRWPRPPDRHHPVFRRGGAGRALGEPVPSFFRHDLGSARRTSGGLVAFSRLRRRAGRHRSGDRRGRDRIQIWTHPEAALTAHHEGGWSYDRAVEAWPTTCRLCAAGSANVSRSSRAVPARS